MSQEHSASNKSIGSQYEQYLVPIWKNLNVPIKRASGCTVEDFDGNEYLDVFSGISVTNAGHTNDAVLEAASDQLQEFVHGCTYLHPNEPAADLAERIAQITPGDLQKTFFCNSGTEAVEGAIKLARKHTGSKEVLALEMSFHGRTLGSLALTGNKAYKSEMAPTMNDVAHVAPPYAYRCQLCTGGPCSCACAEDLQQVVDTHTAGDIAAVVVEPVMGEGGIVVPPADWLERVQQLTHDNDALLIVDEVQTGYGRTGELFATEHFDVVPDILAQAKGIANGLPLGAFTASAEVADSFEAGDHLSTFGGNPVACAAALATIEELEDGIVANAREQGEWLSTQLAELEADHEVVGETRGVGLMQGVELVDHSERGPKSVGARPDATLAKHVGQYLRDEGIIMGVGGIYKNVLRFQPPLTISREQLQRTVETLDDAIAAETAQED
jgi:4-aminobutyrate aminotransferase